MTLVERRARVDDQRLLLELLELDDRLLDELLEMDDRLLEDELLLEELLERDDRLLEDELLDELLELEGRLLEDELLEELLELEGRLLEDELLFDERLVPRLEDAVASAVAAPPPSAPAPRADGDVGEPLPHATSSPEAVSSAARPDRRIRKSRRVAAESSFFLCSVDSLMSPPSRDDVVMSIANAGLLPGSPRPRPTSIVESGDMELTRT